MAVFGASNQLLQIDTGRASTYLFNPALSALPLYANIGENQILGQRYFGTTNATIGNPTGTQSVLMNVQYLASSATTTANLQAGPAPVYWTDNTYSVVSGISTESSLGLNGIAGYMLLSTTSMPTLTSQMLLGAQILIHIAGLVVGAVAPTTGTTGVGNWIQGAAGAFASQTVVAGTAPGYRTLGIQATAVAAGLCNVLVNCDII